MQCHDCLCHRGYTRTHIATIRSFNVHVPGRIRYINFSGVEWFEAELILHAFVMVFEESYILMGPIDSSYTTTSINVDSVTKHYYLLNAYTKLMSAFVLRSTTMRVDFTFHRPLLITQFNSNAYVIAYIHRPHKHVDGRLLIFVGGDCPFSIGWTAIVFISERIYQIQYLHKKLEKQKSVFLATACIYLIELPKIAFRKKSRDQWRLGLESGFMFGSDSGIMIPQLSLGYDAFFCPETRISLSTCNFSGRIIACSE